METKTGSTSTKMVVKSRNFHEIDEPLKTHKILLETYYKDGNIHRFPLL